jgi:hypothetical protein
MATETAERRVASAWLQRQATKIHVVVRDLPEVLQRALKSVRYNRRDVGVESGSSFTPTEGSAGFEGNRGYVIVVDLVGGHFKTHEGAWGGPSPFDQRQVDLDRKPQAIPQNGAVIIGEYGGRGSFAHIRVHPSNLQAILPQPAEEIEKDERTALGIIRSYKSSGRVDEFRRAQIGAYGPDNPLIRSLAGKGLVKIDSRGSIQITTDGRNALLSRTAHAKAAGADAFTVFVKGHDAHRAFKEAVDDAKHRRGHGGYSGTVGEKTSFKLRSSTSMTMAEADEFVSKDLDHNDKWGPAFALPIAESKVKKEGTQILKVTARSHDDAIDVAKRMIADKAKAGVTLEIGIGHGAVKPFKSGSMPEIEKLKGTISYFSIGKLEPWGARYKDRAAAMAALKEILLSSRDPPGKGSEFRLWKVQETDRVVVTEEPSRLPTWEVTAKVREVQKGTVIGYLFYGIASS